MEGEKRFMHEEFKSRYVYFSSQCCSIFKALLTYNGTFVRLVRDVFGKDNEGKVPIEKVIMLIWIFRDDPTVVKFMAQFVAKVKSLFISFHGLFLRV